MAFLNGEITMPANSNLLPASSQDKMNYITRLNADQQMHVVITFNSQINASRLAGALRLVLDREPLLGCRFIEQGNRVAWERRNDLDQLELLQVVETGDVQANVYQFAVLPSDPCLDPLVQARIFRSPAGDTLCLKVNHVAADGAGVKEVAYLVADTYRRLEENPAYNPGVAKFGRRSQAAIFRQAGLKNLLKNRPHTLGLPRMPFSLPFSGVEGNQRSFAVRKIDPGDFQSLKGYAKRHGATINDLILTALYRSMFSQGNPPADMPLPVQVSLDLRPLLPKGKEQPICNLSGALYPAVVYHPGETFEQTLAGVQSEMARLKTGLPGLTGAMLIEMAMLQGFAKAKAMIGKMTRVRSNRVTPLLLSNFGLLDAKRLAFGSLEIAEAFMLGPVMFGHGVMLTASTFAGQMTLAIGYCQTNITSEIVENLLEQVRMELALILPVTEKY
jgi:NRPS condensation-like uncharacterized protein